MFSEKTLIDIQHAAGWLLLTLIVLYFAPLFIVGFALPFWAEPVLVFVFLTHVLLGARVSILRWSRRISFLNSIADHPRAVLLFVFLLWLTLNFLYIWFRL